MACHCEKRVAVCGVIFIIWDDNSVSVAQSSNLELYPGVTDAGYFQFAIFHLRLRFTVALIGDFTYVYIQRLPEL